MTIFKNRHFDTQAVTIDLDVFFYYFVRPLSECPDEERPGITIGTVRDRLSRLTDKIGSDLSSSEYRRSSRGNVHVRLRFAYPISVLDGFMIRAWMMDDQTRLSLDLARYLMTDDLHEMNRCFDEKAESDGVKRAGPWIPLDMNRDEFDGEILMDWNKYISGTSHGQTELDFC